MDGHQIPAGWGVAFDRFNTHVLEPVTFEKKMHLTSTWTYKQVSNQRGGGWKTRHGPAKSLFALGVGPRYCLGADLALVEMQTFLVVLARSITKFDLVFPLVTICSRYCLVERNFLARKGRHFSSRHWSNYPTEMECTSRVGSMPWSYMAVAIPT